MEQFNLCEHYLVVISCIIMRYIIEYFSSNKVPIVVHILFSIWVYNQEQNKNKTVNVSVDCRTEYIPPAISCRHKINCNPRWQKKFLSRSVVPPSIHSQMEFLDSADEFSARYSVGIPRFSDPFWHTNTRTHLSTH